MPNRDEATERAEWKEPALVVLCSFSMALLSTLNCSQANPLLTSIPAGSKLNIHSNIDKFSTGAPNGEKLHQKLFVLQSAFY